MTTQRFCILGRPSKCATADWKVAAYVTCHNEFKSCCIQNLNAQCNDARLRDELMNFERSQPVSTDRHARRLRSRMLGTPPTLAPLDHPMKGFAAKSNTARIATAHGRGYRGFRPIPRLAGQMPEYLENQLRAFVGGSRVNSFPNSDGTRARR